jgi:voltage-gated sodium channel
MKTISKLLLNERFILWIIIVNALFILIEGFQGIDSSILWAAREIDALFTVVFIAEVIVKFKKLGFRKYFSSNWNRVDFVLIALSSSSLLMFIGYFHADLSFLLFLRVTRIFKFFRFFQFIPGIPKVVAGVKRAMKTSIFVLLGVLIYNLIISVLSYYLFHNISSEFFGNPISSFYTTFRIFSVEGWNEIPDKMTLNMTEIQVFFTKLYFIGILLTGGIFGLSIVNSIFVDSMMSDNNDELIEQVKELAGKIDNLNKKIEEIERVGISISKNDKAVD